MSHRYNTLPSLILATVLCCAGCVSPPEAWVPDISSKVEVTSDQLADGNEPLDLNQQADSADIAKLDLADIDHTDVPLELANEDLIDVVTPPADLADEISPPLDIPDLAQELFDMEAELPDVLPDLPPDEVCVPDCDGAECGDDGCGGSCGECAEDPCFNVCQEGVCGPDDLPEEICGNGEDEDCDGEDPFCPPPDKMVHVGGYFIDLLESANCDGKSCTFSGSPPWDTLQFGEAKEACHAVGKRLCSLEEWQLGCASAEELPYPYGTDYDVKMCNTETMAIDGCGVWPTCASASGLLDMVGNASEWVEDDNQTPWIVGGTHSDGAMAKCQYAIAPQAEDTSGFRCCLRWDDDIDDDGYVSSHDCDETNPEIWPGAVEICDEVDNNCDGEVDEGEDVDKDTFTTCFDCNDNLASIKPGALEACDGIDNNCNGEIDENADACDDSNYCTIDVCTGQSGCAYSPMLDGTTCSDNPQDKCLGGKCTCIDDCTNVVCGSDGCGGSCGKCPGPQDECFGGQCSCMPLCPENSCGDDGCGGSCGTCPGNLECIANACVGQCDDGNDTDWDGCTDLNLSEFKVNTHTSGNQFYPRVASFADGHFVVVWTSMGQDGSAEGIYAQRFGVSGNAEGSEIQVHDVAAGSQKWPMLTTFSNNGFVVAWTDMNLDGGGDIHAQVFDAEGGKVLESPMVVNTYKMSQQYSADSSMVTLKSGETWVAPWTGRDADLDIDVYCQAFSTGTQAQVGGETKVNKTVTDVQDRPRIAELASKAFVVAWEYHHSNDNSIDIWAQRFSGPGNSTGNAIKINTYSGGKQEHIGIASFTNNDFVVVWQSANYDDDGTGIAGQRLSSGGTKLDAEFLVNNYKKSTQASPAVAALSNSSYVVAWKSMNPSGTGFFNAWRIFQANSNSGGDEEQLHVFTNGGQAEPDVASLPNGRFVAVWSSDGQDGDGQGIYARCYKDYLPLYRCTGCGDGECDDQSESCNDCPIDCGGCQ
jgi:hypothetical protein